MQLTNLEIAKKCLETYMLEVRQYGGSMAAVEVCDQYLCRAYFALGMLVSEQSKTLKVSSSFDLCLMQCIYIYMAP